MTIPTNIVFPLHEEKISQGNPTDLAKYLTELVFTLQRMYEEIAQATNGNIRADFLEQDRRWTPTLKDTGTAATFTYAHQNGWAFRRGLNVDAWFDIEFSAPSVAPTGNMYIELPYKVAETTQMPFVGVAQTSNFGYTSGTYCVVNAISDTFRAEIWNVGNGTATTNQLTPTSGRIFGHISYIGQQDEF